MSSQLAAVAMLAVVLAGCSAGSPEVDLAAAEPAPVQKLDTAQRQAQVARNVAAIMQGMASARGELWLTRQGRN